MKLCVFCRISCRVLGNRQAQLTYLEKLLDAQAQRVEMEPDLASQDYVVEEAAQLRRDRENRSGEVPVTSGNRRPIHGPLTLPLLGGYRFRSSSVPPRPSKEAPAVTSPSMQGHETIPREEEASEEGVRESRSLSGVEKYSRGPQPLPNTMMSSTVPMTPPLLPAEKTSTSDASSSGDKRRSMSLVCHQVHPASMFALYVCVCMYASEHTSIQSRACVWYSTSSRGFIVGWSCFFFLNGHTCPLLPQCRVDRWSPSPKKDPETGCRSCWWVFLLFLFMGMGRKSPHACTFPGNAFICTVGCKCVQLGLWHLSLHHTRRTHVFLLCVDTLGMPVACARHICVLAALECLWHMLTSSSIRGVYCRPLSAHPSCDSAAQWENVIVFAIVTWSCVCASSTQHESANSPLKGNIVSYLSRHPLRKIREADVVPEGAGRDLFGGKPNRVCSSLYFWPSQYYFCDILRAELLTGRLGGGARSRQVRLHAVPPKVVPKRLAFEMTKPKRRKPPPDPSQPHVSSKEKKKDKRLVRMP